MQTNNKKEKCLIVGANSFLSREIIKILNSTTDITALYHRKKNNLLEGVKNLHVSELQNLADDFDTVFIISAHIPDSTHINEELLYEVNVKLPMQICSKFKSARIIYASSVSVYGSAAGVLTEESLPVSPSLYGASKLEGEKIVSRHPKFSSVRISSMYGEGMNTNTFIPRIIESAVKEKKIRLLGSGSRLQNYIHVTDVAAMFVKAARQPVNATYLAVSEKSYSNTEVAEAVKAEISDAEIIYEGTDQSRSFEYNATNTYNTLGFKTSVSLKEGISNLSQWHQKI